MNSTKEKWAFIINPIAGNHFAGTYIDVIKEKIRQHQINAHFFFTERKGHASEIADNCIRNRYTYIIAVGGDGTINEIGRQVAGHKKITMGIIAAGTGNDMIQILGFDFPFSEAHWNAFFQKRTVEMDIGSCNGNYFLNGMGIGFDAKVASENYTPDGEVISSNASKYLWHILKNLLFFKEDRMHIHFEQSSSESSVFMNTISVGRRFAGKFLLTPKAIADDGLLDVCIVGKLSFRERIQLFMKVPEGKHLGHKKISYHQVKKILIETGAIVPHHLDGELHYASRFDIRCHPAALNMIYNAAGPHFFKIGKPEASQ